MQTEIKNRIKEAIKADLADGKISQNKLAIKCDVSSGMLSHICNDAWENIGEKTWLKLSAYYKLGDTWAIHKTDNFNTIQNLCADTQSVKRMVAISAFSGAGKTAALTYYAGKNKNVMYVMCNFLMTKKTLINSILKACGLVPCDRVPEGIEQLKEFVLENENPLIILDDAGKLNDTCYRLIQLIYDETEFACGIVLSGTEFLKKHIEKMAIKDKMGYSEFYRRIGYWLALKQPSTKIIAQILAHNEIKYDDQLLNSIGMKAKNYGVLRAIITNAKRMEEPLSVTNLSHMAIGAYEYHN